MTRREKILELRKKVENGNYSTCPLEEDCIHQGDLDCDLCCMNPNSCTQNNYEGELTLLLEDEDLDEFIVT